MGKASEKEAAGLCFRLENEFKGKIYLYGDKIKVVSRRSESRPPQIPKFEDLDEEEQMLDIFKDELRRIDGRFYSSVSRSRSAVFEIARCNSWDWFCTLTIDGAKFQRDDLPRFQKALSQWIRDRRKKTGFEYRFLLVPELHKDGENWHMHGLLGGIPPYEICSFDEKAPADLRNGGFKNWFPYERKFGFCSLGKIKDPERVASYISKYVTKDFGAAAMKFGGHLYYASKGLSRRLTLFEGVFEMPPNEWEFENEYVRIGWFDGKELTRVLSWMRDGYCDGLGHIKNGVLTDGTFSGCFCEDMEQMFRWGDKAGEKVKFDLSPQGKA